jgi:hypothetical protein
MPFVDAPSTRTANVPSTPSAPSSPASGVSPACGCAGWRSATAAPAPAVARAYVGHRCAVPSARGVIGALMRPLSKLVPKWVW